MACITRTAHFQTLHKNDWTNITVKFIYSKLSVTISLFSRSKSSVWYGIVNNLLDQQGQLSLNWEASYRDYTVFPFFQDPSKRSKNLTFENVKSISFALENSVQISRSVTYWQPIAFDGRLYRPFFYSLFEMCGNFHIQLFACLKVQHSTGHMLSRLYTSL